MLLTEGYYPITIPIQCIPYYKQLAAEKNQNNIQVSDIEFKELEHFHGKEKSNSIWQDLKHLLKDQEGASQEELELEKQLSELHNLNLIGEQAIGEGDEGALASTNQNPKSLNPKLKKILDKKRTIVLKRSLLNIFHGDVKLPADLELLKDMKGVLSIGR